MFVKSLETSQVLNFKAASFKISNSDSLGVNIVLLRDTVRRYYGIFLKSCGTFRKYDLVSKSEHFEKDLFPHVVSSASRN